MAVARLQAKQCPIVLLRQRHVEPVMQEFKVERTTGGLAFEDGAEQCASASEIRLLDGAREVPDEDGDPRRVQHGDSWAGASAANHCPRQSLAAKGENRLRSCRNALAAEKSP